MELNHSSIHVGCQTFCGDGSNLSDPSETILIVRMPHLCPRDERVIQAVVLPVIVEMVKQFEEKEAVKK